MSTTCLPSVVCVLVLAFLSLLCCSVNAYPDDDVNHCAAVVDGNTYDFSALRGMELHAQSTDGSHKWDFYLNLCSTTRANADCAKLGAMVCAVMQTDPADNISTTNAYAIALPYPQSRYSWQDNSGAGAVLKPVTGQSLLPSCPYGSSIVKPTISVNCGEYQSVPNVVISIQRESCEFDVMIMHESGCFVRTNTDETIEAHTQLAISLGVALAVVLAVLLVVLVIYCRQRGCSHSHCWQTPKGYELTPQLLSVENVESGSGSDSIHVSGSFPGLPYPPPTDR